jgi:hypothetical protein
MNAKRNTVIAVTIITFFFTASSAYGAEGASSNYFPGSYGDFAVAAAPNPGFTFLNYNLFVEGDVERTVLQGRVDTSLDTFAYVNMSLLLYAFEEPVMGGRFAIGGFLPLGYASLETDVVGPTNTFSIDDSVTALGDIALLPASFYWDSGNWHFNLYEIVMTPTGQYDVDNNINMGRNYWSFDTVFALTHLDMDGGREYSFAAGYMINTENDDTNYETGDELHVDAMFNQFLSETFGLGLHGYYYKQVKGDSGSGAVLGDLKGESYGIGPSFIWIPQAGGGQFSISGSWLHDLDATNRLESEYVVLTLAWQFSTVDQ